MDMREAAAKGLPLARLLSQGGRWIRFACWPILASPDKTHWRPSVAITSPEHGAVDRPTGEGKNSSESTLIFLVQNSLLIPERISDKFLRSKFAACMRPVDEVQHWAT